MGFAHFAVKALTPKKQVRPADGARKDGRVCREYGLGCSEVKVPECKASVARKIRWAIRIPLARAAEGSVEAPVHRAIRTKPAKHRVDAEVVRTRTPIDPAWVGREWGRERARTLKWVRTALDLSEEASVWAAKVAAVSVVPAWAEGHAQTWKPMKTLRPDAVTAEVSAEVSVVGVPPGWAARRISIQTLPPDGARPSGERVRKLRRRMRNS